MEESLSFLVLVILISASGVMSPGPLFTANIAYGLKEGTKSGLKMAVGHTIVEFPLIVLLGIGVFSLDVFPHLREIITIFGAFGLFGFAVLQIRTAFKEKTNVNVKSNKGAFIAGILFSGLNPFFLIWWLTIGFKLISDALILWSFFGIVILFFMHIWMDYVWLGLTAFLAKKSGQILSKRNYKILMIGLSAVLVYFGIVFLIEVFT